MGVYKFDKGGNDAALIKLMSEKDAEFFFHADLFHAARIAADGLAAYFTPRN